MIRRYLGLALFVCVPSALLPAMAGAIDIPMLTFTNRDPASAGKNTYIAIVGQTSTGSADPCEFGGRCGDFQVFAYRLGGQPAPGTTVVLDFTDCPDIQLSCDQLASTTGQNYISSHKVYGTTNVSGLFTFKIQGASNSMSTLSPAFVSPGTNAGVRCVHVYGDGAEAGDLTPAAYDVDGLGSTASAAVNAADVAIVKIEALLSARGSKARADYNYDNAVNAGDVGISAKLALTPPTLGTVRTTSALDGSYCP